MFVCSIHSECVVAIYSECVDAYTECAYTYAECVCV